MATDINNDHTASVETAATESDLCCTDLKRRRRRTTYCSLHSVRTKEQNNKEFQGGVYFSFEYFWLDYICHTFFLL